jgi:hypothetical protein
MSGTTPYYGFRIPNTDGSDYQVPDDIRVPVTQIDAKLKSMNDRIGALDANGWVKGSIGSNATTQFKAAANFQINTDGVVIKRQLDMVFARFQLKRLNSDLTVGPSGNIANTVALTIPAAYRPNYSNGVGGVGATGVALSSYVNIDGEVVISNLASALTKNMDFDIHLSWMM